MNHWTGRLEVGLPDVLLGICSFAFLCLLLERLMWPFVSRLPLPLEASTLTAGLILSGLLFLSVRWFWVMFILMVALTLFSTIVLFFSVHPGLISSGATPSEVMPVVQSSGSGTSGGGSGVHAADAFSGTGLMVLTLLVMGVRHRASTR